MGQANQPDQLQGDVDQLSDGMVVFTPSPRVLKRMREFLDLVFLFEPRAFAEDDAILVNFLQKDKEKKVLTSRSSLFQALREHVVRALVKSAMPGALRTAAAEAGMSAEDAAATAMQQMQQ